MIRVDEDALICDLAETYQIYDYRQLPSLMVAVFSRGLREDSRIKMKMSGQLVPLDTLLMAGISDKLSILLWSKTKDAQKGINQPTSILTTLIETHKAERTEIVFNSGEDFEKTRQQLINNLKTGGEDEWQQN